MDQDQMNAVIATALSMALDVHQEEITQFVVVARTKCHDCGEDDEMHFVVNAKSPGHAILMLNSGIHRVVTDIMQRNGE